MSSNILALRIGSRQSPPTAPPSHARAADNARIDRSFERTLASTRRRDDAPKAEPNPPEKQQKAEATAREGNDAHASEKGGNKPKSTAAEKSENQVTKNEDAASNARDESKETGSNEGIESGETQDVDREDEGEVSVAPEVLFHIANNSVEASQGAVAISADAPTEQSSTPSASSASNSKNLTSPAQVQAAQHVTTTEPTPSTNPADTPEQHGQEGNHQQAGRSVVGQIETQKQAIGAASPETEAAPKPATVAIDATASKEAKPVETTASNATPPVREGPPPVQTVTPVAQLMQLEEPTLRDEANLARVSRALQSAVNQRGGAVTLRLHPPELGSLRIDMSVRDGVVNARFTAQTESVRNLLMDQMGQLRHALDRQGLVIEKIEVQSSQQQSASQFGRDDGAAHDGRSRDQYAARQHGGQHGGATGGTEEGEAGVTTFEQAVSDATA